jgi:hypothetical protein
MELGRIAIESEKVCSSGRHIIRRKGEVKTNFNGTFMEEIVLLEVMVCARMPMVWVKLFVAWLGTTLARCLGMVLEGEGAVSVCLNRKVGDSHKICIAALHSRLQIGSRCYLLRLDVGILLLWVS